MKKDIRDGKVAVLYSPGYGAGWSTWNYEFPEILFDPSIVYMVEEMNKSTGKDAKNDWVSNITEYCKRNYLDVYTGGVDDLVVAWLPVGTQFRIEEYDGSETLVLKEDEELWTTA